MAITAKIDTYFIKIIDILINIGQFGLLVKAQDRILGNLIFYVFQFTSMTSDTQCNYLLLSKAVLS